MCINKSIYPIESFFHRKCFSLGNHFLVFGWDFNRTRWRIGHADGGLMIYLSIKGSQQCLNVG